MKVRLFIFIVSLTILKSFSQVTNLPLGLVICDNNNELVGFHLTIATPEIIATQNSLGFSMTRYETLLNADNVIYPSLQPNFFANTISLQTIYTKLTDFIACNYVSTSFNIIEELSPVVSSPLPLMYFGLYNNGSGIFTLIDVDSKIIGTSLTYYKTQLNTVNGINTISSPYLSITPYTQVIYVRVEGETTGLQFINPKSTTYINLHPKGGLKLNTYNSLDEEVGFTSTFNSKRSIVFNVLPLSSGIYFVKLSNEEKTIV